MGFEHLRKSRLQDLNRRFYTTLSGRTGRREIGKSALDDLKVALDPNDGILDWIGAKLGATNMHRGVHPSMRMISGLASVFGL